jgi:hypothetical protein
MLTRGTPMKDEKGKDKNHDIFDIENILGH